MGGAESKDNLSTWMGFGQARNKVTVQQLIEVAKTLETGDLVLFCFPGSVHTIGATASRWTHVGVVYKRDGRYCRSRDAHHERLNDPETVYVMEAYQGGPGHQGPPFDGMNLSPLPKRIAEYLKQGAGPSFAIGIRRLTGVRRTPEFLMRMEELWHQIKDRKYETDFWEKANSALDCLDFDWCLWNPTRNKANETSLFCSELVAMAYHRLGVVQSGPDAPPSNEYAPGDFGEDRLHARVPLINGAGFTDVVWAST
eukprot:tig00021017_g17187.t1